MQWVSLSYLAERRAILIVEKQSPLSFRFSCVVAEND